MPICLKRWKANSVLASPHVKQALFSPSGDRALEDVLQCDLHGSLQTGEREFRSTSDVLQALAEGRAGPRTRSAGLNAHTSQGVSPSLGLYRSFREQRFPLTVTVCRIFPASKTLQSGFDCCSLR